MGVSLHQNSHLPHPIHMGMVKQICTQQDLRRTTSMHHSSSCQAGSANLPETPKPTPLIPSTLGDPLETQLSKTMRQLQAWLSSVTQQQQITDTERQRDRG